MEKKTSVSWYCSIFYFLHILGQKTTEPYCTDNYKIVPVLSLIILDIMFGLLCNGGVLVHHIFIHHSFGAEQRKTSRTEKKIRDYGRGKYKIESPP